MGRGHCFKFYVVVIVYILSPRTLLTKTQTQNGAEGQSCKTTNGDDGICIKIYSCTPIFQVLTFLSRPLLPHVIHQLRNYTCGFEDNTVKVCCPGNVTESAKGPEAQSCKTPDNNNGSCINLHSCKPLMYIVEYLPLPISTKVVESHSCGFEDKIQKVCCPLDYFYLDEPNSAPPNVSNHQNIGLLSQDCGKRGFFAYAWTALLSYKTDNGSEFKCGGTILNDRYILTAAACIKPTLLGVRVGERNLSTALDCQITKQNKSVCVTHQDLQIEEIISHQQFGKVAYNNDISLLRVEKINMTENVRPICLPIGNLTADNLIGKLLTVTGLGSSGNSTLGNFSLVLSKLSLPLVPLSECRERFKKLSPVTKNQICAGGLAGKDSCSGDNGGPLQYLTRIGKSRRYVQYGIISYGPVACGVGGWPSVYTKVEKYIQWILDNIKP